jgi:hypothetical protein
VIRVLSDVDSSAQEYLIYSERLNKWFSSKVRFDPDNDSVRKERMHLLRDKTHTDHTFHRKPGSPKRRPRLSIAQIAIETTAKKTVL